MDCNEIADLCNTAERLFAQEPSVLQIRAPVKIFGDLHGQFGDLMRLFDEYGSPSTAGDITYVSTSHSTLMGVAFKLWAFGLNRTLYDQNPGKASRYCEF